jgi:hypothetical protein
MGRRGAGEGVLGRVLDEKKDDGSGKNRHIDPKRASRTPGRINLKAVAEVLAERGMDPTVEMLKLLVPGEDETGKPLPAVLDADVRARIWNELLQYTQPKLKSVEVRAKIAATAFDINDEQAKRIAEEFLRAATEDEGDTD